jgi:DNA-binding beta-propeller fold protein YncE
MSGISPLLRIVSLDESVQSVMRKQIMPPHTAPPVVAARSALTNTAKPTLNPIASTGRAKKLAPDVYAIYKECALIHTSNVPTTPTSPRDCNRSRASGIAFLHPVSPSTPCISSPIARPQAPVDLQSDLSIANTSTIAGAVLHLGRIEAEGNIQSRPHRRAVRYLAKALQSPAQAFRSPFRFALPVAVMTAAVLGSLLGCGNTYRPVVSAINPVGPAAQPQKFAVVISTTGTPANPTPGLATFVDFSGDSVLITVNIGVNPYYLILNSGGNTAYTLNSDHTLTSFDVDTTLLQSQVLQTTLLPNANPLSIFPQGANTYVSDPGLNVVSQFVGQPLNLQQELSIGPAFTPVYVVGIASAPRIYAISQRVGGGLGQVSTIETTSNTIDPNPIPVGNNPVYGVMTNDAKRAFILNQGDGTVSVINAQTNLLDVVPAGSTNPIAVGTSPLWADFAPSRNEMVVANAGSGANPGSLSIISIPLCSAAALPSNPNCDPTNPVDAVGFGTVLATVPVGINPVMVGVLQDGTRAYVVNGGNPNLPCTTSPATPGVVSTPCTVSVINLTTNTVTATIPIPTQPGLAPSVVKNGHPNYIAVTTGTPTGKVYVTSPESNFMTVIRTDTDSVDLTVPLQGNGVSVRITQP